ncbi:MAG TPA: glycosyltransferase family 2 protein [Pseudonocardiaceae bacterium]|nr:glycosyltransferase family 2 protein [Pseudonocardiaceae bacterium]
MDVVLPCLDEAAALPGVLSRLPAGYRAIVVDNGSTDGTAEVAAAQGAVVVAEPQRGYGAAVQAGLAAATGEVVAVLDGDGSLDPQELPGMVAVLAAGRVDLVVGRRIPSTPGAWPWHARAGNALLAVLLRRRGLPVHDIAAIRVGYRTRLLELGVTHPASGYPLQLLLRAGAAGWRLREVDVVYRPRAAGRSKVSGSVRGTVRAVRAMAGVLR